MGSVVETIYECSTQLNDVTVWVIMSADVLRHVGDLCQ